MSYEPIGSRDTEFGRLQAIYDEQETNEKDKYGIGLRSIGKGGAFVTTLARAQDFHWQLGQLLKEIEGRIGLADSDD